VAHSIFHFAFGVFLGTAIGLRSVIVSLCAKSRLSWPTARLLLLSYGLGALAVFPNVLRRMGYPDWFCQGWWMNICLFHPMIDRIRPGGMLIGELVFVACFIFQYMLLLYALRVLKIVKSE
jgi:hypothetical protein